MIKLGVCVIRLSITIFCFDIKSHTIKQKYKDFICLLIIWYTEGKHFLCLECTESSATTLDRTGPINTKNAI